MSTPATTTTPQPQARTKPAKATLRDHLESPAFMGQIAKVLPKHLTPTRMVRVALTAMTKTPKLADCDQASFFSALLTLSQIGLEPDGRLAHLIPFANNKKGITECQLIVDWKGLAQLAYRSGQVSHMCADVIYSGDDYSYDMGQLLRHVPHYLRSDADKPESAGTPVAAYALAQMKDGSRIACVLSISEVNGIRARSKSGGAGPWVTDYDEMAKKTAFRRLSKWLPLSSEIFTQALDADGDIEDIKRVQPAEHVSLESLARPTEPKRREDPALLLTAALESKGFTAAQFHECLVMDGKVPTDAKTVADVSEIPLAMIEHYVGDGSCSEAIRSMDYVIENTKTN